MTVLEEIILEEDGMKNYDVNENDMRNYYQDKIRQRIEFYKRRRKYDR